MSGLPARAGWHWVKQGMQLFRQQPGAMMALLFCCMFCYLAVSLFSQLIPLVGRFVPLLLAPMFSIALLQGCADIDHGKRALPNLVLIGLRGPARNALLGLGALYLVVMLFALAVLNWLDDGTLAQVSEGTVPMSQAALEHASFPMLVAWCIYMGAWVFTSLAAPLIFWQKMALSKALFFSVVTVMRDIKAFTTGMVILFLMCQAGGIVIGVLFRSPHMMIAAALTVVLIAIVILHCTLYASYRQLFAAARSEPPPAAP